MRTVARSIARRPTWWTCFSFSGRRWSQASSSQPLDVLLKRRPDLAHISLTCDNTNIVLPYTDLVSEILEYFVVHNKLDADAARTTEHITAEELSVNSQYTLTAAYIPLQQAVYPPSLPFDRPYELVRAYLEQQGSSRAAIIQTFLVGDNSEAVELACEGAWRSRPRSKRYSLAPTCCRRNPYRNSMAIPAKSSGSSSLRTSRPCSRAWRSPTRS